MPATTPDPRKQPPQHGRKPKAPPRWQGSGKPPAPPPHRSSGRSPCEMSVPALAWWVLLALWREQR